MYRISELVKADRKIFHTNDLAVLWKIDKRQSLYTLLSRYVDRGILYSIYKGLYSVVPVSDLDPLELGRAIIHRYTYLTTESVLAQAGAISQPAYVYTFASDQSKQITIGERSFRFRQLKDVYLHNPAGIEMRGQAFIASPERAAADMLYFNPKFHFDVPEVLDFGKLKMLQGQIGYPHAGSQA